MPAASSFSFCRASLDHTVSSEELSYQLPRRAGGGSSLTWHDGRGQQQGAHTRTVKLLQQPGTEGIQSGGGGVLSGVSTLLCAV
ncbi:unnamed protein product [Boreogadus saida]